VVDTEVRAWFGWKRWTWTRIAFAVLCLANVFALYVVTENSHRDDARQVEQDYKVCVNGNALRLVIGQLVDLTQTSGVDYTKFKTFANLPPEFKAFLLELQSASSQPSNPNSFSENAHKLLAPRDCDAEFGR
jgi:hypothetical protein